MLRISICIAHPILTEQVLRRLAAVEPSLKDVAKEIMESESSLPADQRTLLEPLDVVGIFDIGEVQEIAMQVMELSGVLNSTKVTVVDQLKN